MYAVVEIAGQQFRVTKDQKLYVNRLSGQVGSSASFSNVLLVQNDNAVKFGNAEDSPNMSVNAKILSHLKGDKVIVFKKKRRKGYRVKNGHRQHLTQIQIESIG